MHCCGPIPFKRTRCLCILTKKTFQLTIFHSNGLHLNVRLLTTYLSWPHFQIEHDKVAILRFKHYLKIYPCKGETIFQPCKGKRFTVNHPLVASSLSEKGARSNVRETCLSCQPAIISQQIATYAKFIFLLLLLFLSLALPNTV